ncbi:uncharacterized protein LOC142818427 isoform X2 [Pelodiscus sinensis]|uniref:uncharacterized protein LOC142818427 isoform X2 n=1 Tax=Pelodiscus sinensis TaxID=13735 RepID=UPI003F6B6AA0
MRGRTPTGAPIRGETGRRRGGGGEEQELAVFSTPTGGDPTGSKEGGPRCRRRPARRPRRWRKPSKGAWRTPRSGGKARTGQTPNSDGADDTTGRICAPFTIGVSDFYWEDPLCYNLTLEQWLSNCGPWTTSGPRLELSSLYPCSGEPALVLQPRGCSKTRTPAPTSRSEEPEGIHKIHQPWNPARVNPRSRWEDQEAEIAFDSLTREVVASLWHQHPKVERPLWRLDTSTDWWDRLVLGQWDDQQWLRNFRMRKRMFLELCAWLAPALQRATTRLQAPIPVDKRVTIALWKLATRDSYHLVAQQFRVGRSTVGVVVMESCPPA